jgi:adenine specific DNA methylase Mod
LASTSLKNISLRFSSSLLCPPSSTQSLNGKDNTSFNYNDNFNHSTWLTFMKNRLEVARELLNDDGVIFVNIDDNEQGYLKVLMDGIFETILT